jgi:hypothetical protein
MVSFGLESRAGLTNGTDIQSQNADNAAADDKLSLALSVNGSGLFRALLFPYPDETREY